MAKHGKIQPIGRHGRRIPIEQIILSFLVADGIPSQLVKRELKKDCTIQLAIMIIYGTLSLNSIGEYYATGERPLRSSERP